MASLDDTVAAVAGLLPTAVLELAETIRESEASRVLRVRASGAGWTGPETLIVKRYAAAAEGWAREIAALSVVPTGAPSPRLVAFARSPALVVMTDAGAGPSVADALLSGTPAEATAALEGFADALADFHLATLGVSRAFAAELTARAGGSVSGPSMTGLAARAASGLATWCERLGVAVPHGALPALTALPDRVGAQGPSSLTPADACPDNNVRTDDGYLLIDFEEAQWRPVAWDAAYLTVPWPSCWCSFRIPDAVAGQALARYRNAVAAALPYAATPEFAGDVAVATTGWALITTSWFIGNALGTDPPQREGADGLPTRRARILHRLAGVCETGVAPELTTLAGRLRAELVRRWGEVPLEYAPAFRGFAARA